MCKFDFRMNPNNTQNHSENAKNTFPERDKIMNNFFCAI